MADSTDRGGACILNAGDVFAGYAIDRLLGTGGMGEVYGARHPRLPRREALKILNDDISADEAYRQRFIREADLAAVLWHPNIVRINDRGDFDGRLWISMDFVDGTDAASLLRDHYPAGMPADQVATIVEAIACALDYAHGEHDVLHRDVSPANILICGAGSAEQRILLSDFGIARTIGDTPGLTATNMMIGTFPYAAPEQLTDEPIDEHADQYALAATAYHLLTGSTLFPHTNPAVVISRHLSAPPPRLEDTRPALKALDPVFAVALAKEPGERFHRCSDFADAFARAIDSAGAAPSSVCTMPRAVAIRPKAHATRGRAHRGRGRVLAAAALAVAFTGLGAADYVIADKSSVSPPAAATGKPQPQLVAKPATPSAEPHSAAPPSDIPPPPSAARAPAPTTAAPPTAALASPVVAAPPSPAPAALRPKAPPPPQRPPDQDQTFINTLSGIPGLTVTDPATAAATGRAICKGLQNGATPDDSVQATVKSNSSLSPAQAAAGVNAAIATYCPQYQH
ncbi:MULTISPECIES: serine/threonine-protein kinase [unclassified Mycobacterium]|uniref:serine/threonine-protein kinase n=1 Tax=unclassified Mycobacterium TaxID=2642494 RepID=UPI0027407FF0|nr:MULTISPECIES: serine/threonine-protein kinase [unclassified Mycobacterium]MDP7706717.1 serine/threonine-protein kinase [Mycobacterium sp. TY815]MDP7726478.1 serine/threonine-protein kinase [Mycobacterium sp. TY814]